MPPLRIVRFVENRSLWFCISVIYAAKPKSVPYGAAGYFERDAERKNPRTCGDFMLFAYFVVPLVPFPVCPG